MEGVKNVSIESGDKAGTQKVLVVTDGSTELSKRDAIKSLGDKSGKYKVRDWGLAEVSGSEEETKPKETTMKSTNLAEMQEWTNAEGTTIKAAVRKVEGGNVYFIMEDGKMIPYPANKLSPETVAKLRELIKP